MNETKNLTKAHTDRRSAWPERYYGVYDPSKPKPTQITGWYDTWDLGYSDDLFSSSEKMFALTPEQWDWHFQPGNSQAQINEDGSISRYVSPPLPPLPLKKLAENALGDVEDKAPMIVAMGESFGPKTKAYVKMLQAIINGTDTSSTQLSDMPDDLTT